VLRIVTGHSIRCMSHVNVVQKRAGTILSDGIINIFYVLCDFYGHSSSTQLSLFV
jgi:hypothetical protein